MGRRGPAKTPTQLRILRGRPDKRPLPVNEPEAISIVNIEPPDWLRDEAKMEWYALAPALIAQGVLTETDRGAFANYCTAFADLKIAESHLQSEGDLVEIETKHGPVVKQNPWVHIKSRAQNQCDRWGRQFGIGPANRAGLSVSPKDKSARLADWKRKYGMK